MSKEDRAIEIIKLGAEMSHKYYYKPLIITYSGGKDSDVLADLAVKSGADVEFQYNCTTVDAPETMRHIKKVFEREREDTPQLSIIRMIKTENLSRCLR